MQVLPVNIIQCIFVFQMLFGIALLWQKKQLRGLHYLLMFAAVTAVFNLFEELGNGRDWYLITPVFLLAKGPLFFLFVYQLVYPEKQLGKKVLFHLCPMLIALPFTYWPQWVIAIGSVSQLIYAFITIRLIMSYHNASFSTRSDAESSQLFWVIKILITFLVIGGLDLIRLNLQPYIPLQINLLGQLLENSVVLLLFSLLIYKAVQQHHWFSGMSAFESTQPITTNNIKEHSEISIQIFTELELVIQTKSLHHQPRLSLNDLANETGLHTRDISQAINQHGGCSFCDYINKLRIEDIKQKLKAQNNDNKMNVLDLAFTLGFNSKSSFNAVFKREIGCTPTQYIKQHKHFT